MAPTNHPSSRRQPPDLSPEERSLAHWFSALERQDAPGHLREAVLSRPRQQEGSLRLLSSRIGSRFPLGAWGMATAALVLVALGAAVGVELTTEGPLRVGEPVHDARADGISLIVERDPAMALFHGLETFDDVGLAPGELIPDWGR